MKIGRRDLADFRVLIVDDEPSNIRILSKLLEGAGYESVSSTSDAREAIPLFRSFGPDLLLLDLHMPHMDGFEILDRLGGEVPEGEYFPVLVLTGDLSGEVRARALGAGARDFLTKPFDATEALLRIENLAETRILHRELRSYSATLETRVEKRTRELRQAQIETIHRLALAAEYRDDTTGRHAERVGITSALIARDLDWPTHELRLVQEAATLHDVGKIGIPDAVLLKPGPLSRDERDLMKRHTEIGARILSGSRSPLLRMATEIALSHHERWDGTGYPHGLAADAIPQVGRIVALADVFDALTHERPYKRASEAGEAVALIRSERERHFDPDIVDVFERLVERGDLRWLEEGVIVPWQEYAPR